MLNEKKTELAKVARECYVTELMEDLGLDYEEADEMIKDFEEPEKLTELLYQTTVNFYQKEFEKKCM